MIIVNKICEKIMCLGITETVTNFLIAIGLTLFN